MERKALAKLRIWKEKPNHKPLLVYGPRRVGKTWLLKEFGKGYKSVCYFNFKEDPSLNVVFKHSQDTDRIIEMLSMVAGKKVSSGNTLLILDDIQECTDALEALKAFGSAWKGLNIIAAGSYLGLLDGRPDFSDVEFLELCPLDFHEFLMALDPSIRFYYEQIEKHQWIDESYHRRLLSYYDEYLIIGGMPECVLSWENEKDPALISKKQSEILGIIQDDFSYYWGSFDSGRLSLVFHSLVSQLAKPNEKFMYGAIKEGARGRDFEEAIDWLSGAGIVRKAVNVSEPIYPLKEQERPAIFKLYFFDTGLLKHMAGLENSDILLKEEYPFKRALTENFVLQQLYGLYGPLHYYAYKETEIDFLLEKEESVIPVEVKSGEGKAASSFRRYVSQRKPEAAIRYSKRHYKMDGAVTNIPLYLVSKTKDLI